MALGKGIKRARWPRLLLEWKGLEGILEDQGQGMSSSRLWVRKSHSGRVERREGNEGYGGMPEDEEDSPVCRCP
jgi:hypothetical protein